MLWPFSVAGISEVLSVDSDRAGPQFTKKTVIKVKARAFEKRLMLFDVFIAFCFL